MNCALEQAISRTEVTNSPAGTTPESPATLPESSVTPSTRRRESSLSTFSYFRCEWDTLYTQQVVLVGNCAELGNWKPENGVVMKTSDLHYPCWYTTEPILLPTKVPVEYKYCLVRHDVVTDQSEFVAWEGDARLVDQHAAISGNRSLMPQGEAMIVEDEDGRYRFQFCNGSNKPKGVQSLIHNPNFSSTAKRQILLERRNTQTSIRRTRATSVNNAPLLSSKSNWRDKDADGVACNEGKRPIEVTVEVTEVGDLPENHLHVHNILDDTTSIFYVSGELPLAVYRDRVTRKWTVKPKKDRVGPSLWENRDRIGALTKRKVFFVGLPVLKSGVQSDTDQKEIDVLLEANDCIAIWMNTCTINLFQSFTYKYLWHVFHQNILTSRRDIHRSHPVEALSGACPGYSDADRIAWEAYKLASHEFVDVLVKHTMPGDMIWFNDLHCLMMPPKARIKLRGCTLGLFFHVPVPSSEIFRMMPSCQELLKGILSVDALGFQFFEYARHFLVSIKRLFALEHYFKAGGTLCVETTSDTGSRLITISCCHTKLEANNVLKAMSERSIGTYARKMTGEEFLQFYGKSVDVPMIFEGTGSVSSTPRMDSTRFQRTLQHNRAPSGMLLMPPNMPKQLVERSGSRNHEFEIPSDSVSDFVVTHHDELTFECILNNQLHDQYSFQSMGNQESGAADAYYAADGYMGHNPVATETLCSEYSDDGESSAEGKLSADNIQTLAQELRRHDGDEIFHFIAVDRLCAVSSLRCKFRAYYKWLEQNEDYGIPRRVMLRQYCYEGDLDNRTVTISLVQDLIYDVNLINKRFGKHARHGEVISLMIGNLVPFERMAIFLSGDGYINTSWRDGLCLDPFEYILVRGAEKHTTARIVISEFVGSASTLSCAKRVNPWDDLAVGEALSWAFHENEDKRWLRSFQDDYQRLRDSSIVNWAASMIHDIEASKITQQQVQYSGGFGGEVKMVQSHPLFTYLDEALQSELVSDFKSSKCRLILLDHEGTITQNKSSENKGLRADGAAPESDVISYLNTLSDPGNCPYRKTFVVVMSGRAKCRLENWFSHCSHLGLAAEHGFVIKYPGSANNTWKQTLTMDEAVCAHWKNVTKQLMESHVAKTYGAKVENKGSAITFQYRDTDPDFGTWSARELEGVLIELLSDDPCEVLSGKGYVEVRQLNVNKGTATSNVVEYLKQKYNVSPDFVLAIGDDRSDEDMFKHIIKATKLEMAVEERELLSTPTVKSNLRRSFNNNSMVNLKDVRPQNTNKTAPDGSKIYTCTVGRKPSSAHFFVNTTDDVKQILRQLARGMTGH